MKKQSGVPTGTFCLIPAPFYLIPAFRVLIPAFRVLIPAFRVLIPAKAGISCIIMEISYLVRDKEKMAKMKFWINIA